MFDQENSPASASGLNRKPQRKQKLEQRMPVIFAGHGSPMNAIEANRWSDGFSKLARNMPKPKAVLAISAHWYVERTFVMSNASPRTIHDFGGFPQALYEVQYPASGHRDLARQVHSILSRDGAELNANWGLDHGSWSVLRWMFPQADVPVIQLSIDRRQDPLFHYTLGRALAPLRDESVLILASGNAVHNLQDAFARRRSGTEVTPGWAEQFDDSVQQIVSQHDTKRLLSLWPNSDQAQMAHPTPDHWFPLLYAAGASDPGDTVSFSSEGFDWGSISMRNILFGTDSDFRGTIP